MDSPDTIVVEVNKETVDHLLGVIEKRTDHFLAMGMTGRTASTNALYDVLRQYERDLFDNLFTIINGGRDE